MLVKTTDDGSKTVYSQRFGEHYGSTFGAAGESKTVFIDAGYTASKADPVSVLEIGFGTGLNAYLTLREAERMQRPTYYESVELYPLEESIVRELSDDELFRKLHFIPWEQPTKISPNFVLHKRNVDLLRATFTRKFDVVYFDAFSPSVQPEMWSRELFAELFAAMNSQALLTTYCAKGEVRRTLQRVGFVTERLPGPPGKREMLRAVK